MLTRPEDRPCNPRPHSGPPAVQIGTARLKHRYAATPCRNGLSQSRLTGPRTKRPGPPGRLRPGGLRLPVAAWMDGAHAVPPRPLAPLRYASAPDRLRSAGLKTARPNRRLSGGTGGVRCPLSRARNGRRTDRTRPGNRPDTDRKQPAHRPETDRKAPREPPPLTEHALQTSRVSVVLRPRTCPAVRIHRPARRTVPRFAHQPQTPPGRAVEGQRVHRRLRRLSSFRNHETTCPSGPQRYDSGHARAHIHWRRLHRRAGTREMTWANEPPRR